jgi:hypothetical protein
MDKLPHFQKQHVSRLLKDDNAPDVQLLTQHVLDPIEAVIREIESKRHDSEEYASLYGDLMPDLSPEYNNSSAYIKRVLKISKIPESDVRDFVNQNKYLFWKVPQTVLEQRQGDMHLSEITLRSDQATSEDVATFLFDKFKQFSDPWKAENLGSIIKKLVPDITYVDSQSGRLMEKGGYKFLRWALLGLEDGPTLSSVMDALGREETIRRLELARRTAGRDEDGLAQAAR